jgi:hypothetical protein
MLERVVAERYEFRLSERLEGRGATQLVGLVASNENFLDIPKILLVVTRHRETR